MNVLLLFPPLSIPTQPYLSLPSLTAVLRRDGHEVTQRDLNIEFYDTMLSADRLAQSYERVLAEHQALEAKPALGFAELRQYTKLSTAILGAQHTIEHIDECKASLRSPAGYATLNGYTQSSTVILRALALLSAEYYPMELGFTYLRTKYADTSARQIIAAAADESTNPFLTFYRERVLPQIDPEQYGVIGISIPYYYQTIPGFTLARLLKAACPNAHIVVGGCAFTEHVGVLQRNQELFTMVDSFVVYEGETAISTLVGAVEAGQPLTDVPNLIHRDAGGEIRTNRLHFTENVSALPTPDFDGLPLDLYFSPRPVLPLGTSRGCYWGKCTFCTHDTIYSDDFRSRRFERVLEDIVTLSERYGARHFEFVDSTMPPRKAVALADAIADRRLGIEWFCYARAEPLYTQDPFVERLARGGCRMLMLGVESAVQRVTDLMQKGTHVSDLPPILENCHRHGVAASLFFMLGFPTETPEEAEQTFRFIADHKALIDGYFCVFGFGLVRHSKAAQLAGTYGLTIIEPKDEDLARVYDFTATRGMDTDQAHAVQMALRRKYPVIDRYLDEVSARLLWRGHCLFLHRDHYAFSAFAEEPATETVDARTLFERYRAAAGRSIYRRALRFDIATLESGKFVDTAPSIRELMERKRRAHDAAHAPRGVKVLFNADTNRLLRATPLLDALLDLADADVTYDDAIARVPSEGLLADGQDARAALADLFFAGELVAVDGGGGGHLSGDG